DAAEALYRLLDRRGDLGLVADVADHRKGFPARGLDLLGGGVDRARQLRMRLGGLGGDGDVGPIFGRTQRDRQADATRTAGDENGLVLERHAIPPARWRQARTERARRKLAQAQPAAGFTSNPSALA